MVNLDVLTSGNALQPNGSPESQRMASLIDIFSATTILQSLTLLVSVEAEAPILGKMADGILLVVHSE